MKKFAVLVVLLSLLVVSLPGAAAAQSLGVTPSAPATLYFVHGFAVESFGADGGQPFNLVLNDAECLTKEVRFGQIAGPFSLAAGSYKLAIVPAQAGCAPAAAVARIEVSLSGGESVSVVAHVSEKAEPSLSSFVNFTASSIGFSAVDPGFAPYLVVRNTSAVSPMNVVAAESKKEGARYAFRNLYPGGEASREVTAGLWKVTFYEPSPFFSALGRTIASLQREFKGGQAYFLYPVGSTQAGTFQVLEHTLPIP